jgi:hypothetical protein
MPTEASSSKSLTPRQREWLGHLHAWRQQGGSLKAYALAHELSISALYTARQSLTRRGVWQGGRQDEALDTPKLVPVRVRSTPTAPPMLRVVLPNGVVVEVPEQADVAWCRALLVCVSESMR